MAEGHRNRVEISQRKSDMRCCTKTGSGRKLSISSRFVLKIERNSDQSVNKCKDRLVIMSNIHDSRDAGDIFSPTVNFTTVSTVLSMAQLKRASMEAIDVRSAFIYDVNLKKKFTVYYLRDMKGEIEPGFEVTALLLWSQDRLKSME